MAELRLMIAVNDDGEWQALRVGDNDTTALEASLRTELGAPKNAVSVAMISLPIPRSP